MENESYIQKYLEFTDGQEAPEIFHIWSAVASLGFAVGRSVWLDRGSLSPLYPNHFVILVAGSGACRKGGALGTARKLVRDAIGDRIDRLLIPGKVYPEALIRALNKRVQDPFTEDSDEQALIYRPTMLFSPELGSFLSKGMQNMGMPDLLTEIYDCPDVHEHITKNSGQDKLQDVHVSLLGATTPAWMQENMTPAIFGEGFVARTILVFASKPKKKVARPRLTQKEIDIRIDLIEMLRAISVIKGEMKMDEAAGDLYDTWYLNRAPEEGLVSESGFYEREHDHVQKLSMIFSLSAGANKIIYPPHVEAAIKMVGEIKSHMHNVLAGAQAHYDQRKSLRVLTTIKTHGGGNGITAKDLGRRLITHMDIDTIFEILTQLRTTGMIESQARQTSSGEKIIFYRTIRYFGTSPSFDDTEPFNSSQKE